MIFRAENDIKWDIRKLLLLGAWSYWEWWKTRLKNGRTYHGEPGTMGKCSREDRSLQGVWAIHRIYCVISCSTPNLNVCKTYWRKGSSCETLTSQNPKSPKTPKFKINFVFLGTISEMMPFLHILWRIFRHSVKSMQLLTALWSLDLGTLSRNLCTGWREL